MRAETRYQETELRSPVHPGVPGVSRRLSVMRSESGPDASTEGPAASIMIGQHLEQLQRLAHALEKKDRYTWGHSARVSTYAVAMGRWMALSVDELDKLALGGELHDIGKIGISDALLLKRSPLTPEEYVRMLQHTVIGVKILSPFLSHQPQVISIVAYHHERFDGAGSPEGLMSDAIPLLARIIAVADAFDAMTTERPYRMPQAREDAYCELEVSAGEQFDPDCVDAARAIAFPD